MTHDSDKVKYYVGKVSLEGSPRIHLALIDTGLTSIQSPPDVIVIKQIKKECRLGCQRFCLRRRGVNDERHALSRE